MTNRVFLTTFLTLSLACASPHTAPNTTRDGRDCAHAIPIRDIKEEYQWIGINEPGSRLISQSLSSCKDFPVDILRIQLPNGSERAVYFDITIVMQEEEKMFNPK